MSSSVISYHFQTSLEEFHMEALDSKNYRISTRVGFKRKDINFSRLARYIHSSYLLYDQL